MSIIERALRVAERLPVLGTLPCPPWVAAQLAAHVRRQRLVLDIAALGGRDCAFVALWLARWYAIRGGTVEEALHLFRRNLAR